jgi:hypothetical protein
MIGEIMKQEVYAIVDLNGYVSQMREAAANSISENGHSDNLDFYISLDQMVGLVKNICLGFDDNNHPLLNEERNQQIFEEAATWIHNVGLAKLAAQDLIECAWDDKLNEMVFWQKEPAKDDKPKRKRKRKNS